MNRRVVLNLVAVAMAVIAGLLVFFYVSGADQRAIANKSPVPVLVTTGEVIAGLTLDEAVNQGLVESVEVPALARPGYAVAALTNDNRALYFQSTVTAGQLVLNENLAATVPESQHFKIPAGYLAVTLELTAAARADGILQPGSEVAVFATSNVWQKGGETLGSTRAIVPTAEVLLVGEAIEDSESSNATSDTDLVTLAVTVREAEILIHEAQTGMLYLALHGEGSELVSPRTITNADVFTD